MTGRKLFKVRFLEDMKYQQKILGIVVNWTVWLYIFLPFAIVGVIFYIDWWRNIASYWFEPLNPNLILVVFLLFFINSRFRSFMQEADQLFLLDRLKLYNEFRWVTYAYSLLHMLATTFLAILLVLPWLVKLVGLNLGEVLLLFIYLMAFRVLVATILRVISHRVKRGSLVGIVYFLAAFLIYLLPLTMLFVLGAFVLVLVFAWHVLKVIPTKRFFFHEVSEENKERVRYAKFILGMATSVEKPPTRLGKRPFLFRKSRRIFKESTPENGLLEVLIKGLLRHSVYLRSYLHLIGLTLFAITVFPVWMKWIVYILFVLFLQYNAWLKGLYEKMLDEYFFTVVPIKAQVREAVWLRFKRILMIPAVSFTGFVTLILTIIPMF